MVNETPTIHNLALVGFMGTGKTSVGKLVAAQLRFRFLDTDEMIEARAKRPIPEIFEQEGEARFREYERVVVQELESFRQAVVSTGGGLVINPANMASLKTHALVVCLWAGPDIIWQRVRHQSHRPLLNDENPRERIRELLRERESSYRSADVLVNTGLRSLSEAAHQVIHHFRMVTHQTKPARHR